jgi:hypothetical protein
VDGVTTPLPWEPPPVFLHLRRLPRRSLIVLPATAKNLVDASYGYYAKGVRFDPNESEEFDLIRERRLHLKEDMPQGTRDLDYQFDEAGRFGLIEHPRTRVGGLPFSDAEHEFAIAYLAAERRSLSGFVDEPKLYGVFDKIGMPDGRQQGFVVYHLPDFGLRGDEEMTSTIFTYLGLLMTRLPDQRRTIVDCFAEDVKKSGGKPELVRKYLGETDPARLSMFARNIDLFERAGLSSVDFKPLADNADCETMDYWRGDIEAVVRGTAASARNLVEHGIVQMQPHAGNFRFKREGPHERTVVACDFHHARDLWSMPYPQAVGFIAGSVRNLAVSARSLLEQGMVKHIRPRVIEASLGGFFAGFEDSRLVDLMSEVRSVSEKRLVFYRDFYEEAAERPVTEVDRPLFSLVMDLYPRERHEREFRE